MRARWFVPVVLTAAVLAGCAPGAPQAAPPATVTVTVPPSTTSATPTPTTTTTSAAPDKGKCLLADVRPQVTATTGETGQRHTTVTWTNVTSSTCSMNGYGGVDLQGPPDPTFGPTYSLPRQTSVQPRAVRLAPGEKAHTVVTWSPGDWTPTKLLITPPDETHSAVLDWPGGGVSRQDGATHPGTYLGPVEAGAAA
ncbi:DUF4232 domain-containing protein [Actinomycetospora termitidis]|uniref:DUF4232 domain-containing protein n=1 Tax=Actinomycetospora termitidis TaxID=3053470 RepID=A0ABT7M5X7_9PSEU|nr:DUF4232 domain-containing protein [Actinomycetospora sp. Odt1-22]MDL5155861.1 DUF4232 domain-containing protein [Actinomycetospora sp. Odt1-22]